MNPIQKFIVLNLFENTDEVFKFIHRMNIRRAKNNLENMAFKYKAAKLDLVELNESNTNFDSRQEYRYDLHTFITQTDEQIVGMTK